MMAVLIKLVALENIARVTLGVWLGGWFEASLWRPGWVYQEANKNNTS